MHVHALVVPCSNYFVSYTDFGPLKRTGDADRFKEQINSLSASDRLNPGMCLSGLLVRVCLVSLRL